MHKLVLYKDIRFQAQDRMVEKHLFFLVQRHWNVVKCLYMGHIKTKNAAEILWSPSQIGIMLMEERYDLA